MAAQPTELHVPQHPVRIVSASALFDGHDASINIMRRIMQAQGAEVIHLGHNRSVQEVVDAAVEEEMTAAEEAGVPYASRGEAMFNLGYYTWVEQQATPIEVFDARRSQSFWSGIRRFTGVWDEMIADFNARVTGR